MNRDAFDVYKVTIDDTNHLNLRRQAMDSFYVALLTFVLSGDGYVAYNSTFASWLTAAITVGLAAVGLAVLARWRQALNDFALVLGNRYALLRKLEETPELTSLGATVFSDEYAKIYKSLDAGKHTSSTKRLQNMFIVVFVLVPIVVTALTAANMIPAVHHAFPPGILPGVPT